MVPRLSRTVLAGSASRSGTVAKETMGPERLSTRSPEGSTTLREASDPDVWLGLLREDLDEDPVTLCRELRMSSYHPEATALLAAPALVGTLHAAGLSVVVWTSNDATEWDVLTVLGVDGIITDRPGALREQLPA